MPQKLTLVLLLARGDGVCAPTLDETLKDGFKLSDGLPDNDETNVCVTRLD